MRLGLGFASVRSRGRVDAGSIGGTIPKPRSPMALSGDGLGIQFSFGGAVASRLLLGLELSSYMFPRLTVEGDPSAWAAVNDDASIKYTSYGGILLFYPFSGEGFHSGVGVALINAWTDSQYPSYGISVSPQLGYDVRLDENWSIGAALQASFSRMQIETSQYEQIANVALPSASVIVSYD
jgi:hypothetical protein